jgi:ABC-type sugar transport system substrate-binding protein
VDLAALVLPWHLEDQLALGLAEPLEDLGLQVLGMGGDGGLDAVEDLADGLVELGLGGIAAPDVVVDGFQLLTNLDMTL